MKKIIILFSLVGLVFGACEDDLDQAPISEPSAANFYRNTEDFEQAVNGIYNALNSYSTIHFNLSEIRSDNVYSPGTGVREWNPINNFDKTLETNPLMATAWDASFRGIFRANTVLDQINAELVPEDDIRDRMIGEAKFLRALFYFDLVRYFGPVPVFDQVVTPSEALEVSRTPVAEVYDLIMTDLNDAISLLPDSYGASQGGRATSMAARGILAKVHLTRSGPNYGIDGPGIGVNEYGDALTLLNEIINSGEFSWVTDYASIFDYDNEGNGDIVFAVQNINDGATGDRGIGTILPTLMYHESWARINLPFAGGVPGDSPINPSPDLLASFDAADVRDDQAVLMSYVDENSNTVSDPQFVKFMSLNHVPADRFNWGINFPVLRYTDVLLMKAEALIQSGGNQGEIDQIVNDVRTRAGLTTASNVDLDMLLEERRKEFIAEGHRWHDLVRTGQVVDVMNAWVAQDDDSDVIPTIVANDILYAIHQSQLEVKEGLYSQNPGY